MKSVKMQLGTFIVHHVNGLRSDRSYYGIVTRLYSAQAFYEQADGHYGLVLYSENWKPMGNRKPYKGDIEYPTVWRDHQSRTAILLDRVDEGDIKFIPISDGPFDVCILTEREFRNCYLEPIDYPIERAARLFVEYSRDLGATPAALKALKTFTHITNEDSEMAKAKTAIKPTKKKAATKKAAKKVTKKSTRGPSAASMFKEMLMEKGSDGKCKHTRTTIWNKVQKKFDLPARNKAYVAWYFNDLEKKGKKPPPPHAKDIIEPKKKAGRPPAKKK